MTLCLVCFFVYSVWIITLFTSWLENSFLSDTDNLLTENFHFHSKTFSAYQYYNFPCNEALQISYQSPSSASQMCNACMCFYTQYNSALSMHTMQASTNSSFITFPSSWLFSKSSTCLHEYLLVNFKYAFELLCGEDFAGVLARRDTIIGSALAGVILFLSWTVRWGICQRLTQGMLYAHLWHHWTSGLNKMVTVCNPVHQCLSSSPEWAVFLHYK